MILRQHLDFLLHYQRYLEPFNVKVSLPHGMIPEVLEPDIAQG